GVLAGTNYSGTPAGIEGMLVLSSFLLTFGNASFAYAFFRSRLPRFSPWTGFALLAVLGTAVSFWTIWTPVHPSVDSHGGIYWGLPFKLSALRGAIYFLGIGPLIPVEWSRFRCAQHRLERSSSLGFFLIFATVLAIVAIDFYYEPLSGAPALMSEVTILLATVLSIILYAAVNFGVLRNSERRQRELSSALKRSLEDTIQSLSAALESRDQYTSGHQERVARLSGAIARELGMGESQIDAVSNAAILHDIGKIKVPLEYLTSPARLNKEQFAIIQNHVMAGYEILRGIEFPWPLARIVKEHHERIDGSGYPEGLLAEETLPESRVLSVADVVEAISSDRPYRPALGLEPALEEIEKNRGILYDPEVVDACLRLFREKGFSLDIKAGD
ncbi:MAG: HD-GYP domain-containing protein, partial [Candidatus Krumholzibacteria bacterium]|nr:HD-GYP domain-containing protein [Candidatus Krumholzibacteria bacterium]